MSESERPPVDPLREDEIEWVRRRFGPPNETGHPQDGTLEGLIARLAALASPAAPRPEGLDVETASLVRELAETVHHEGSIRDHVDTTQNKGWTVAGIETCGDPLCVAALARLSDTGDTEEPT